MKKTIITLKINKLKLNYYWFTFLHFVTKRKFFIDKKIKTGILILSLMALLTNCQNEMNINIKRSKRNQKNNTSDRKIYNETQNLNKTIKYIRPYVKDIFIEIDTSDYYITCYEPVISEPLIYESYQVDEQPFFEGGEKALMDFFATNIKYPEETIEGDIHGSVYIRFVINSEGKVENPTVLRGRGDSLDIEALRIISMLPKWKPAKIKDQPVSCYFVVPIRFELH